MMEEVESWWGRKLLKYCPSRPRIRIRDHQIDGWIVRLVRIRSFSGVGGGFGRKK